ncbi:hypothetical protein E4T38_05315 [Aureobasidium subglaciale]|nr:hypothetical protein E4T38_05315 [Aureobasidium subglaciale]KAI5221817.1 hypothetical protein E4T40_05248 [Aureobasidium subglaciale]KAI5225834.1 hypothetical protein E4T41_05067 [Aureobasidium subglaciale]KAI5261638.1 hypothetical protein E4T46_04960 [Aureobasidium subglaciale]
MTSVRNSTYSMHSVADAHLLAMLDGKQDECGLATQVSRLSAFFPTKLLETILIVPGTSRCKDETDMSGNRLSATSFDDMQRSIQVIGLPKPERSKSRLKLSSESERIIEDAADDDLFQDQDYDPEPQMQYLAPDKGVVAFTPKHRQQGCGYRHPPYSGPDRRRLTFQGADGNEGVEVDITMVQVAMGMAEVGIQVAVCFMPKGRYLSDGIAVVAVVDDFWSGQSLGLRTELEAQWS